MVISRRTDVREHEYETNFSSFINLYIKQTYNLYLFIPLKDFWTTYFLVNKFM
jgi:hypothetical protein